MKKENNLSPLKALGFASVWLALTLNAQANDAFSQALLLPGVEGAIVDSSLGATSEPGEPALPGAPLGLTRWYHWTAPASGLLEIHAPADQRTIIAIAEANTLPQVQWLASNAHRMGLWTQVAWRSREFVSAPVRAGQAYLIAADAQLEAPLSGMMLVEPPAPPPPVEAYRFTYNFTPAPAHDEFANASVLTGLSNTVTATNFAASTEPGEPTSETPGGSSVWYQWTAPISGRVNLGMTVPPPPLPEPTAVVTAPALLDESIFYDWGGIGWSTGSNTSAVEYDGISGSWHGSWNLTLMIQDPVNHFDLFTLIDLDPLPVFAPILTAYQGDQLNSLTSLGRGTNIVFEAQAGRSYHFAFEGASHTFGNITFYAVQTPPPANDSFANALLIENSSAAQLTGHLVSTSREPGEPDLGPEYAGGSAWFHYKASTFGTVGFLPNESVALGIFRGTCLTNLTLVAKTNAARLNFFGEDGADYWIAVYKTPASPDSYAMAQGGPRFRRFDTTVAALQRVGFNPHLFGLKGATAILYAKTETGWRTVEIEPISNYEVVFSNRIGAATDKTLKVVTIDEPMPGPHAEFVPTGRGLRPVVVGYPGQICRLAYSTNLTDWTTFQTLSLTNASARFDEPTLNSGQIFYRVTQNYSISR